MIKFLKEVTTTIGLLILICVGVISDGHPLAIIYCVCGGLVIGVMLGGFSDKETKKQWEKL